VGLLPLSPLSPVVACFFNHQSFLFSLNRATLASSEKLPLSSGT
jgi:hypothetical protein